MAAQGRLFEFGNRISCSFEYITIIVKSNPKADQERHGRMKDNIAWLAEGANARITSLDLNALVAKQHAALTQLMESSRSALKEIDQRHRNQGDKSSKIFVVLQAAFDRTMLTIGITQSQEEELANLLQDAAKKAKALYDEGLEISEHLDGLLLQLESV